MRKFKKIYIEITNTCNLECDFCPRTMRKLEFMSIQLFNRILEEIKEYTEYIFFHVKGEPLLHPQLDKFLDLSNEKGFKVNITTNGTLINRVGEMLLTKPALRQINFSLHSFDGNEGFQDRENYIGDILSFTKEAIKKSEIIVALRFWNLSQSNVINLEKKINNKLLGSIEREFNLPCKIEERIIPERGMKIADRVYVNQDYQFQWPDIKQEKGTEPGFCHGLRNQVAVLVDGTVVPCCLDGDGVIELGNVNTTSFSEIIESDRASNIVDGFTRRKAVEELCKKCGYRKRFER